MGTNDQARWEKHQALKASFSSEPDEKWPTDRDEEATREMVALGDEKGMSAMDLLELYLSVEDILRRHNQNPRKLRDAMSYLSRYGNE